MIRLFYETTKDKRRLFIFFINEDTLYKFIKENNIRVEKIEYIS